MHLNKSPWRRAVRASVSLAAVVGMVGPLCADPVEEVQWRRDFANSVLEIVRPAYEGLTASGLPDALRSMESELGLTKGQSFHEISWGDPLRNTDHSAQTRAVGWASPGDRAGEFHQQRSAAQIEDDAGLQAEESGAPAQA